MNVNDLMNILSKLPIDAHVSFHADGYENILEGGDIRVSTDGLVPRVVIDPFTTSYLHYSKWLEKQKEMASL